MSKQRVSFQESSGAASLPLGERHRRKLVMAGVVVALLGAQALVPPPANAVASPGVVAALPRQPAGFADLVERVSPAVVSVATTASLALGESPGDKGFSMPELPEDSPFSEFFRHFFDGRGMQGHPGAGRDKMKGLGSGFIIDPSGYVVTNDHVIKNADDITVVLSDGSRYPAQLRGRDPKTDLALLKVEAEKPLPFVQFGDSQGIRPGDWVVAVGNPFGLGGSVSAGIVSARGRDINSGPFDDYIQIDAPINQGNSGGPLFGLDGRVVGVNTAIYSPSGGNVGIGFAIPASQAGPVLEQLKAHGSVARGWLGVQIQPVSEAVAQSLGIPADEGALVAGVEKDSPAAKAGLKAGDLILRYDGKALQDFRGLPRLVAETKAGSRVQVRVLRQGRERDMPVTIGAMPQAEHVASAQETPARPGTPRLGLQIAPVTPEARERYGIAEDAAGVLVVGVRPGSPAAKAGIQPGSVVSMVGQTPVATPEELAGQVQQAAESGRPSVLLLVRSGDEQRFLAVKFENA
jgi:serine protease Do